MKKENEDLMELLKSLEKINDEAQEELKAKSMENRKLDNLILSFQQIVIQESLHIQDCRNKFPKLFPEGEILLTI
jgi:hypothetical protein